MDRRWTRTGESPRLGWSAWLHTQPAEDDPQVLVDPAEACGCAAVPA